MEHQPAILPWPELKAVAPSRSPPSIMGVPQVRSLMPQTSPGGHGVYNTSTSLEKEQQKDEQRHAKLVAQNLGGRGHRSNAAMLIKIRREIDSQREALHNMLQPAAGFEERLKALKERERIEAVERAERIKARYDKSNKLRQEKEALRSQQKEEERLQIRRRAGSLVGGSSAPRRLPPLRGSPGPSDVEKSLGAVSMSSPSPCRSTSRLSAGGDDNSVFLTSSAVRGSQPRPFTEEDAEEQLNALRDLRVAQEAEETLEKAMLRTHRLVMEANRRAVRAILHSGHDLKGFMLEPAMCISRFARAAFSAFLVSQRASAIVASLSAELQRRELAAEEQRLADLLALTPIDAPRTDDPAATADRDIRSPGGRHRSSATYAPAVNVAAFVLDIIDSTGLVMTREYVTEDLAAGRLLR
jgi:hypothetical protein